MKVFTVPPARASWVVLGAISLVLGVTFLLLGALDIALLWALVLTLSVFASIFKWTGSNRKLTITAEKVTLKVGWINIEVPVEPASRLEAMGPAVFVLRSGVGKAILIFLPTYHKPGLLAQSLLELLDRIEADENTRETLRRAADPDVTPQRLRTRNMKEARF